jgi:hypothetical protein
LETILGFSARLYEVRQLSWRPAQVNARHFFKACLYSAIRNQAVAVQPGRIHGGPVRGRSLFKGDRCTSRPLSSNIRRRSHLRTPRKETLPTRSEEEQTVVMICRPNSKITPFTDVYLIYVLCSLFFAPLGTDFNFLSVSSINFPSNFMQCQ